MTFQEPTVRRDGHRIYVRDYPGEGNPILLMHGFPDNLHLYDRVVPHLTPTRRVGRSTAMSTGVPVGS